MIDFLIPLVTIVCVFGGIYAIVRINDQDIKKEQKKQDADYNKKMLNMCVKAKTANVCPHCCLKCSWGTRMEDGVIYFSKGEEK